MFLELFYYRQNLLPTQICICHREHVDNVMLCKTVYFLVINQHNLYKFPLLCSTDFSISMLLCNSSYHLKHLHITVFYNTTQWSPKHHQYSYILHYTISLHPIPPSLFHTISSEAKGSNCVHICLVVKPFCLSTDDVYIIINL